MERVLIAHGGHAAKLWCDHADTQHVQHPRNAFACLGDSAHYHQAIVGAWFAKKVITGVGQDLLRHFGIQGHFRLDPYLPAVIMHGQDVEP
ncbi:hypothetical protein ABGT16_04815 [Pseudomonas asiatica]|uniref:hypothetical protein n=1 Tax=Pseudomonas asiatica TaxID=2219225 RepID=UPI00345D7DE5